MDNAYLTPINIPVPPQHTQIKPRCLTCKSFSVCNVREDYLKTATLIENIFGNPQQDYEYREDDGTLFGHDFDDPSAYFPETIVWEEHEAHFMAAKYLDKNLVRCMYNIDNYYVLFQIFWLNDKFEITKGREFYYGLEFTLPEDASTSICEALKEWRREKEQEEESKEVINTTFFSAVLNCQFYERDKNLTEKQGYERMRLHCPYPHYHHIATYHCENKPVKPYDTTFSPVPLLYPVFVPAPPRKPKPPKPHRRDDVNEF